MAAVVGRIQDASGYTKDRSLALFDSQIPPSKRDELVQNIRIWANANPKLAAFVFANLLLSAPPTLLFLAFSTTTLVSSLLITVLTALTVAFSFTAFCAGLALLILLPTLLITTVCATFLFLGGLISYAIVQRFNNDPRTEPIRVKSKETILSTKDKVNDAIDSQLKSNDTASESTLQPSSPTYPTSNPSHKNLPNTPMNFSKQSPPTSKSSPRTTVPGTSEYGMNSGSSAVGSARDYSGSGTTAAGYYGLDRAGSEHRRATSQHGSVGSAGGAGAGASQGSSGLNSRFSPLSAPPVQPKPESFSGRMTGLSD